MHYPSAQLALVHTTQHWCECLCSAAAKGAPSLIPKTAQAHPLSGTLTDTSEQWQLFCSQQFTTPKPQNPNNNATFQNITLIDFLPLRFILHLRNYRACLYAQLSSAGRSLCKWDTLEKPGFNYVWAVGYCHLKNLTVWQQYFTPTKHLNALQVFQCIWYILSKLTVPQWQKGVSSQTCKEKQARDWETNKSYLRIG